MLARVANLYYKQHMNQSEIADMLSVSRPKVSRMLKKAWELGILEIRIKFPDTQKIFDLEKQLMDVFGLRMAIVVPSIGDQNNVLSAAGAAAADMLLSIIGKNSIIGCSWGLSLMYMLRAMHTHKIDNNVEVVQLIGSVPQQMTFPDGSEFARHLSTVLQCRCNYLLAPVLAKSRGIRDLLISDPNIRDILEKGRRSDLAIVGIGALGDNSLLRNKIISPEEIEVLAQKGAVAEVCACFIDREGKLVESELNDRAVTIGLESLKKIETVMAVALGQTKHAAVAAVLRGGYLDILVTDEATAASVLQSSAGSIPIPCG